MARSRVVSHKVAQALVPVVGYRCRLHVYCYRGSTHLMYNLVAVRSLVKENNNIKTNVYSEIRMLLEMCQTSQAHSNSSCVCHGLIDCLATRLSRSYRSFGHTVALQSLSHRLKSFRGNLSNSNCIRFGDCHKKRRATSWST